MLRSFCCSLIVLTAVSTRVLADTSTAETIELSASHTPDEAIRVAIEVEAGGHNLVQPAAEADAETAAKQEKLPMSVSAKIEYDEIRLGGAVGSAAAGVPLAVRHYERADAVIKVAETGRTPKLADDRRLVVAAAGATRPVLYSPNGPMSREQIDLIDVVGDPLTVNGLLPAEAVAKDESWSNDAAVMGPLLTLDSVAVCEVKSVLESFNASFAKLRLAGTVHGTADGAATEIEVRAVYLFDRNAKRVTKLNLAVRERRSIGGATPGVDAVAKLQISISAVPKPASLNEQVVAKAKSAKRSPARDVAYESGPLGVRFAHDRNWFVTSERRESVTMRRVDGGDLVAQCTLTALPAKSAGRQTTLEQFQKDVTFSLGKNFGEMVSSRQWQNAAGLYCYELVVRGLVDEVPIEWHYYLLAPESGERVSAAITLEKPMVDRIGHADRDLIESIQLFPRMPSVKTASRATTKK